MNSSQREPALHPVNLNGIDVLTWNPLRLKQDGSSSRVNNFGDLLGPLLVERMLAAHAMDGAVAPAERSLLSIGSILHLAPMDAVVWGSGVNFKLTSKVPRNASTLDIRSVRGPHTARALSAAGIEVPSVFGDPALLLPRYVPEFESWTRIGDGHIIVIPNLNDFERMSRQARAQGLAVVDPRSPLTEVLAMIAGSGGVIGSSLHGVAIAEALGLPGRFVASPAEGSIKYLDYLVGSGRPDERIAESLEEALTLGSHAPIDLDLDALAEAFPRDLWGAMALPRPKDTFQEDSAVLAAWAELSAAPAMNFEAYRDQFFTEILPAMIDAGEACLSASEALFDASLEQFNQAFGAAQRYRTALAPGMHVDGGASNEAVAVMSSTDARGFLRYLWLRREGPHAVLSRAVQGPGQVVISAAVRPGATRNDITGIEVGVEDERGNETSAAVPVFAMYHRQWSIDVTAVVPLPPEATTINATISLVTASGDQVAVPVRVPANGRDAEVPYPRISSAPRWELALSTAPAAVKHGRRSL